MLLCISCGKKIYDTHVDIQRDIQYPISQTVQGTDNDQRLIVVCMS